MRGGCRGDGKVGGTVDHEHMQPPAALAGLVHRFLNVGHGVIRAGETPGDSRDAQRVRPLEHVFFRPHHPACAPMRHMRIVVISGEFQEKNGVAGRNTHVSLPS